MAVESSVTNPYLVAPSCVDRPAPVSVYQSTGSAGKRVDHAKLAMDQVISALARGNMPAERAFFDELTHG
jgi:hypothetical protein